MRLFIGLRPSPAFVRALAELQAQLRRAGVGGRYLSPDNLHLTLAFIGNWPEDVTALLPPVEEPFPIVLSRVGVFARAKVLWAGVEPSPALDALAGRVRRNLDAAEVPYDPQPFKAHITLARKPVLPREDVLSRIVPPRAEMTVREVCLYKSERDESGMRYTVIGISGGMS